jgi:hypothetical protein
MNKGATEIVKKSKLGKNLIELISNQIFVQLMASKIISYRYPAKLFTNNLLI